MSSIHLLDKSTVNKIAAGEVVERPASCVKELVENSIDAGAKRIEIEIQSGGKSLIRVTDDGEGMSREDASLSILRHATSKLSTVRDLLQISTLGFRGEALPTISAVSKFTLQTRRTNDELGTKIKIDGGKISDTHEVGCKNGTTILVEDLFFNTPARLKFLKSTATEANKIHEFIVKLSLSHPEISFKLINGNRTALTTPGTGKILDTLTAIYGTEMVSTLLDLNFEGANFKLTGFIAKPNFLRSYRSWQTFIINGRIVSNRTISKALDESYKSLIPKSGFPLAVIKIDVPQNTIDVNVHPQKTELKFEDEGIIFKAVYRAVHDAISEKNSDEHDLTQIAAAPDKFIYEPLELNDYFGETPKPEKKDNFIIDPNAEKKSLSISELREKIQTSRQENFVPAVEDDFENEIISNEKFETPTENNFDNAEKLQPIGQVALCYIIAQSGKDLYIVDQHAAHERILFDRLSSYADKIPAQGLLIHRILKFDRRESQLIEKNLELFSKLGFTMEPSGENEFRLTEIPADASDTDAESMFKEIISKIYFDGEIDSERQADIARNIRRSVLAVTACRAAVKAGHELNMRQMQIILDDLSKTPNPYTCPHGRPTIIKFSNGDLDKMFKRTGF